MREPANNSLKKIGLILIKKVNYQIHVSELAWRALPAYGRGEFLKNLPLDLIIEQPFPKLRQRRCIRLDIDTAAKLEVIATVNKLRNPWLPSSTGTRYGSGKLGLAIEAIGQHLAYKGRLGTPQNIKSKAEIEAENETQS